MDVSLIIIYQFKKKGVELLLSYITCCLDDNDKGLCTMQSFVNMRF